MSQGKTKLGNYIAYLRTQKDISVEELAYLAEIAVAQVQAYESGEFDFDPDELGRIAKVFELKPGELFDFHLLPEETESLQEMG